MPRFFVPNPLGQPASGATISLPMEIAHHLHVLRMNPGDAITLFDGNGGEFNATLAAIDRRSAQVTIERHHAIECEMHPAITLAQALPEGGKMEWIIEKATELGVAEIIPLRAQRSVTKVSAERQEKKRQHWQSILIAACEQCGRNRLPTLHDPVRPDQLLPASTRLLLTPRGTTSLAHWLHSVSPIALTVIIGPEGGFSDTEETAMIAAGAVPVTMGQRVLRTETAGLAALAMIQAAWDEQASAQTI